MQDDQWQNKINRAKKTEQAILEWVRKNVDNSARLMTHYFKEFDIKSKKIGNIEIKEDRLATKTGYFAIEFEDCQGKPSGIKATTAKQFCLVDDEYVIFIDTDTLCYLIGGEKRLRPVEMGYTSQEGRRAKGYLFPRRDLIHSPYATVMDRWFE